MLNIRYMLGNYNWEVPRMTTSGGLEVGLSPSTLEIFASRPLLGPRTKDEREDQGREKIKFGLRARKKLDQGREGGNIAKMLRACF